jgi:hypothetical protein
VRGIGVFLFLLLLSSPTYASQGEHYLFAGLGYLPISTADGYLHAATLSAGFGWDITDFTLVDAELYYAAAAAPGGLGHLAGAEASFRLLIDATEWVPSVGPSGGWAFSYSPDGGLDQGPYLGATACLQHRTQRESSQTICGEAAVFPFLGDLQGMYLLTFRLDGFLPYLFD